MVYSNVVQSYQQRKYELTDIDNIKWWEEKSEVSLSKQASGKDGLSGTVMVEMVDKILMTKFRFR